MRKQSKRTIRRNKQTSSVTNQPEINDIPTSGAEVEVHYEYRGKMIWWPGVMETTTRNGPRAEYLGRGTIVYDARDDHDREQEVLRFLPGRKVLLSGKEGKVTSWRFTVPAVDSEKNDRDFENGDRRPSKKRKQNPTVLIRPEDLLQMERS